VVGRREPTQGSVLLHRGQYCSVDKHLMSFHVWEADSSMWLAWLASSCSTCHSGARTFMLAHMLFCYQTQALLCHTCGSNLAGWRVGMCCQAAPLCALCCVQFGSSGDNRMATLKLTADDERQLLAEKPALKQIYDTQVRQDPEPGWRRGTGWVGDRLVQQALAVASWCVARCGWAMLATQLQQALRCGHPGSKLVSAYMCSEVCCLCFVHTTSCMS
jgi:hypothetical protein